MYRIIVETVERKNVKYNALFNSSSSWMQYLGGLWTFIQSTKLCQFCQMEINKSKDCSHRMIFCRKKSCMGFNVTVQRAWMQQWHQIPCNALVAQNKSQSHRVNGPLYLKHCLCVLEMASLESLVSGSGDHLRNLTVTHTQRKLIPKRVRYELLINN